MAIAAFLTAQLPARTMSSQCCCFLLYLPNLSWKGRVYMSVYMSVYLSMWARVWGFVGLEETLLCVHTKALCLQQGNDTLAEQKKLDTMLASVPSWSYDTGKKTGVPELHRYQKIYTIANILRAESLCQCTTCLLLITSMQKRCLRLKLAMYVLN